MKSENLKSLLTDMVNLRHNILSNVSYQEWQCIHNSSDVYSGYKIIDLYNQTYTTLNTTQNIPTLIKHPEYPGAMFLVSLNTTSIQIKLVNDTSVEESQSLAQELGSKSSKIKKINKNHMINITQNINDHIQIDTLQKNDQYISLILSKADMNISNNFGAQHTYNPSTKSFAQYISLLTSINNQNISLVIKENKNKNYDNYESKLLKKGTIKIVTSLNKDNILRPDHLYDCEDDNVCKEINIKLNDDTSNLNDNSDMPLTYETSIFGLPVNHTSVDMLHVNPIDFHTAQFMVKSIGFFGIITTVGGMAILSIDYKIKKRSAYINDQMSKDDIPYSTSSTEHTEIVKESLDYNLDKPINILKKDQEFAKLLIQDDYKSKIFYCNGFIINSYLLFDIYYNSLCVPEKLYTYKLSILPLYCKSLVLNRKLSQKLFDIYYDSLCIHHKYDNSIIKVPVHYIYTNVQSHVINDTSILKIKPVYTILPLEEFIQSNVNKNCLSLTINIDSLYNEYKLIQNTSIVYELFNDSKDNFLNASVILYLPHSCINSHSIKYLEKIISQDIEFIDLSYNYIGPYGIDNLCNILKNLYNLKVLKLAHNYIRDTGLAKLANCILNNLRVLDLASNNLENEGLITITYILKNNTSIKNINLSSNDINDVSSISNTLEENTFLTELTLTSTHISDQVLYNKVLFYLKQNKFVEGITSSMNNFNKRLEIAKILKGLSQNKVLEITHTKLNHYSIELIAEAVKNSIYIKKLDLSANNMNVEEAITILKAIRLNPYILELDLSFNNIGSNKAEELAEELKQNLYIKKIDLSTNNIDFQAAKVIIDAIKYLSYNLKIDLSENSFNTFQGNVLLELIRYYPDITVLGLTSNDSIEFF